MKWLALSVFSIAIFQLVGQQAPKKSQKPICGNNIGVIDCNEYLDLDEKSGVVFHRRTGKPFSGQCETCHDNGVRERMVYFVDGKEDGFDTTWYANGNIQVIRSHMLGVEHGQWQYFHEDGTLAWSIEYMNGNKAGNHLYYDENGNFTKVEKYNSNGQLHGTQLRYYSDNKLRSMVDYKNGVFDGKYYLFSRDSVVLIDENFVAGEKHGENKRYYESGDLLSIENFNKGIPDGNFTYFYEGGQIYKQYNQHKGEIDGLYQEFYEDGKLKIQAKYKKGKMIEEKIYDEFGNEVHPTAPTKEEGEGEGEKKEDGEGAAAGGGKAGKKEKKEKK